jgi:nuclear pore complex protein Nup160
MATYISYHLVHAHLPAPPSIPNAIPELHVPTQQTFPTDLSLLSTPNHPEQAISFAHNSDANVLARLIHNGYTLELRGCSLEIQKAFPANDTGSDIIRVTFPQALRPLAEDSMVVSRRGQLYVFALGQDNTLYRLSFPLDQGSLQRGGRTIFTVDQDETWFEEWSLPEEVVAGCWGISTWTVVDEGTVVLGGMDGGIIRVNCDTPGELDSR